MVGKLRSVGASRSASTSAAALSRVPGKTTSVQDHPQVLRDGAGNEHKVHIEAVAREQGRIVIVSWSTSDLLDFQLDHGNEAIPLEIDRHRRDDVAQALGLPSAIGLGFSLVGEAPSPAAAGLLIAAPGGATLRTGVLAETAQLPHRHRALVPALNRDLIARLRALSPGSPEWRRLLSGLPTASAAPRDHVAHIENLLVSPEGGGVLYGWALHAPDALLWIEDERGGIRTLSDAFRRWRRDIRDGFPDNPWSDQEAAFVLFLPGLTGDSVLKMKVATERGVFTLAQKAGGKRMPADPRAAAELLFSIETEERLFHKRAGTVDWPILTPLVQRRMAEVAELKADRTDFGRPPAAPETSVIVPLYGRFDFIEHQMLEFSRDPSFREGCELIYVIDDPGIEAEVLVAAEYLHRLFDLPFSIVSGRRNRGFSGANNLGADHARGRELLFMNSDVIPQGPGWLAPMRALLAADARNGVVGPRLLFANGGLQHAGMNFERLDKLGIWINRHPNAGLSPDLDPAEGPVEVPAVTGACMLIRRETFDGIGGWDTGYLIGDFEDSDLCLKLREGGYRAMYHPGVALTHLERQSFSGIGQDHFKIRVTIANAVRHQDRWRAMLGNGAGSPDPAAVPAQGATEIRA